MKLPGSRPDVLRTKSLSGPSPVGGSYGGTDSQKVMTLDDFELQAAHYNMACAHARLGNLDEVRFSLFLFFGGGLVFQKPRGKSNGWCSVVTKPFLI